MRKGHVYPPVHSHRFRPKNNNQRKKTEPLNQPPAPPGAENHCPLRSKSQRKTHINYIQLFGWIYVIEGYWKVCPVWTRMATWQCTVHYVSHWPCRPGSIPLRHVWPQQMGCPMACRFLTHTARKMGKQPSKKDAVEAGRSHTRLIEIKMDCSKIDIAECLKSHVVFSSFSFLLAQRRFRLATGQLTSAMCGKHSFCLPSNGRVET